jgi:hypothetical protein
LLRYFLHPTFISLQQVRRSFGLPVLGSVSLVLRPEHRKKRRLQRLSFVASVLLLVGVFGGVVWYRDTGTAMAAAVIADMGAFEL